MIPKMDGEAEINLVSNASLTYAMNFEKESFLGKCDGLQAIKQSVYKILNTERYMNEIYSWGYGIELHDLIGNEELYIKSEVKQRIYEALTQDDRIESIENFASEILEKHKLLIKFKVVTAEGQFDVESEVKI